MGCPMASLAAMETYRRRVEAAVAERLHHDQRRAYLQELLREGFGIDSEDVELERNVRVSEIRGRIDLLYRHIVFEVKRDLAKEHDDVLRELRLYLTKVGDRAFGLATDGLRFEAYRLAGDEVERFDELDLAQVDDATAFAWLDAYLFTEESVAPTAEDVVRRFGPRSAVFLSARDTLRDLWQAVRSDPAVAVKREEWDRLLRMVYGSGKGSDDLFLRHTYLALVARLFAYLAIGRAVPRRGEEFEVITGRAFVKLGIENLVEEDFFAWVAGTPVIARAGDLLAGIARHLSVYATERIDEDLLKELYETLVDPVDRHDLGEYYTPDWLADLVLREAGYGPGARTLDPACGSGTFLFSAIRILREAGLSGGELVQEAQTNLMGFDVHPLAVTVARANFVLALRDDALRSDQVIAIPVWMADSLAVPEQRFGRPIEVQVHAEGDGKVERFTLPTEMEDARPGSLDRATAVVADYADPALSDGDAEAGLRLVLEEIGAVEFLDTWIGNLRLFRKLVRERRNSVWAFVLSNAVRPQVVARRPVDLVVGNPPWLPLRDISESAYQERVTQLALDYGVLPNRRGWRTGALELATVFACFAADHFLRPEGRLAFVLPRGVLHGAKQHDAFRELRCTPPLTPVSAFDLKHVEPLFRVPACAVVLEKRAAARKPPWPVRTVSGRLPRRNASREEALGVLSVGSAVPLGSTRTMVSPYLDRAVQGATIAPRPFWFVVPKAPARLERWYVATDPQASARAKEPWTGIELEGEVEVRYLFATVLAIYPFRLGPIKLCALPIEIATRGVELLDPTLVLRRGAPAFHRWLTEAEELWSQRKKASTAQDVPLHEYLDNHRNLTRQRPGGVRLAYGSDGSHVRAAVVDTDAVLKQVAPPGAKAFVFDMNMYAIRVTAPREAHFLAAVLNTPFVDDAIKSGQTQGAWGPRHIHRRPFEAVGIPEFDATSGDHLRLAQLSEEAHRRLEGLAPARTLVKQLEPVADLVAEADRIVRRICTES